MSKLHLGCGLNTPTGWINIDGSLNARMAKYPALRSILQRLRLAPEKQVQIPWNSTILIHDLRKPLPFQTASIEAIYASHVLEHLYLSDAKCLLKDCFRVLRPGGILRMVVPDLRAIIDEYWAHTSFEQPTKESGEPRPADKVNMRLLMRSMDPPSGNLLYRLYSALYDFHSHKWMYDTDSLSAYFQWAGFMDIGEMAYKQSRIDDIESVEQPDRLLNGAGVCVEGVKPKIIRTGSIQTIL